MDDLLAQWENLHLKVGSRARITGLASRADLNGLTAVITLPANAAEATSLLSKGRVKVSTTKDDLAGIVNDAPWITLSVKPTNLEPLDRPAGSSSSSASSTPSWRDNLPPVPGPVGDADVGDANFEASQRYIELACQAGNAGNIEKEQYMLESLLASDPKQPAAAFNLAQLYRNKGEMTRAIKMIEGTAILLSNSALVTPSEPDSVMSGDDRVSQQVGQFKAAVVRVGSKYCEESTRGKSGAALEGEAKAAKALTRLIDRSGGGMLRHLEKAHISHCYHVLGNILRKVGQGAEEGAITALRKADEVMHPQHDLVSLQHVPDILARRAMTLPSGSPEQSAMLHEAVEDARKLVGYSPEGDQTQAFNELCLARMLFNMMGVTKLDVSATENQPVLKECLEMAIAARKHSEKLREEKSRFFDERVLETAIELIQSIKQGPERQQQQGRKQPAVEPGKLGDGYGLMEKVEPAFGPGVGLGEQVPNVD